MKYMLPLLVSLVIFPLWFLGDWHISVIQTFSSALLIPLWSGIYCGIKCNFSSYKSVLLHIFFPVLITLFSVALGYVGWGISTGGILNPDNETVHIVKDQMLAGTFVSTLVVVAIGIRYGSKKYFQRRGGVA